MHKEFGRDSRLAQQIQQEMALILQREIKDPRLHRMITVSDVEVSKDLSHAKVYVNLFRDWTSDKVDLNLTILNDASGYIRSSDCQTNPNSNCADRAVFTSTSLLMKGSVWPTWLSQFARRTIKNVLIQAKSLTAKPQVRRTKKSNG